MPGSQQDDEKQESVQHALKHGLSDSFNVDTVPFVAPAPGMPPLTGGGQAGDCKFTVSGVDQVSGIGTVVPGVGEEPTTLKKTIEHAFQVSVAGLTTYTLEVACWQ